MADLIQKLADEGEAAYRTKSAEAFAAWLIPNVLLVLGALKTLAEVERDSAATRLALRAADRGLLDWLHMHASDMCDPAQVHESSMRIDTQGGTLAYIGRLRAQIAPLLTEQNRERGE